MALDKILASISLSKCIGSTAVEIDSIETDSRRVTKGALFVAVKGLSVDGHAFIAQAISKGAVAVLCEQIPEDIPLQGMESVTFLLVEDAPVALAKLVNEFYGNPSAALRLVGVTGTNGKTSVASWLFQLFKKAGYKVGLISTVENFIHDTRIEATHTTPDVLSLHRLLSQMVDAGCAFCFMEVSSHAIHQERISGLVFEGAIFTNISHDHLDYHGSFKEYIRVKKLFFDGLPRTAFALVNADDKNGAMMLQNTEARKLRYATKSMAEYAGKLLEQHLHGMLVSLENHELWTRCIGLFNLYNLLAVYGAAIELGLSEEETLLHLSTIKPVDGRFENVQSKEGVTAIMDYAHTPDALENVLQTIVQIVQGKSKIISVVGAGGNRDKAKRPAMAEIASRMSDLLILTSDNPRDEEPEQIIRDMEAGIPADRKKHTFSISDRKEAIRVAVRMASPADVILIAGKGHEHYQEVKGVRYPFNDKEVIKEIFQMNNETA